MNKNILSLLIAICIILQFACKRSYENAELESLKTEVMAVHDEVMPEIKYMTKLGKQLKALNKKGQQPEIQKLVTDLEVADSLMFDWMRNYKAPGEDDVESAKLYLKNQLQKIELVSKKMKSSIANAEQKLNAK